MMRVALVALLRVDSCVSDFTSDDIRVVTELITHLWSLSKKSEPIPEELLPRLNYHLRCLVPPFPILLIISFLSEKHFFSVCPE